MSNRADDQHSKELGKENRTTNIRGEEDTNLSTSRGMWVLATEEAADRTSHSACHALSLRVHGTYRVQDHRLHRGSRIRNTLSTWTTQGPQWRGAVRGASYVPTDRVLKLQESNSPAGIGALQR